MQTPESLSCTIKAFSIPVAQNVLTDPALFQILHNPKFMTNVLQSFINPNIDVLPPVGVESLINNEKINYG